MLLFLRLPLHAAAADKSEEKAAGDSKNEALNNNYCEIWLSHKNDSIFKYVRVIGCFFCERIFIGPYFRI